MKQKIMSSTILTNETGRSMVEMLGVLAIVGVLSVGGVYGYGVAMKKHKANELLHQASMLASSIAAQIASGKTDLALENFGNSSNGSFSSVKGPDGSSNYQSGDDKFTMQITGMDEAVCKQMQAMKGGMVRSVSCSAPDANGKVTATLAFNKDLSSTPVASDYNDDSTGGKCEGAGYQWCDGKCKTDCCDGKCTTGQTCVSGTCMNSECKNSDCSCSTRGKNTSECSSEKPYCVNKICVSTMEDAPCWNGSSDCKGTDAPYCDVDNYVCMKEPEGAECNSVSDCGGSGYCVSYMDGAKGMCRSTVVGHYCDSVPRECQPRTDGTTDAPYCVKGSCSKNPEGAVCYNNSDCGGDAPYCDEFEGICSKTPPPAKCDASSDCTNSDAPYCFDSVCVSTAEGAECASASDCKGTDAQYCNWDTSSCSKSPEGAICKTVADCGGTGYCHWFDESVYEWICFSSLERAPCISPGDCADSDAPYCISDYMYEQGECSKSPEGALCNDGTDCGDNAPYCVDQHCSKTQS